MNIEDLQVTISVRLLRELTGAAFLRGEKEGYKNGREYERAMGRLPDRTNRRGYLGRVVERVGNVLRLAS